MLGLDRGFTLVELMIVVVIVAILAAVASTSYKKWQRHARLNEGIGAVNDIRIKQETFFNTYSRYLSSTTDEDEYSGTINEDPEMLGYYDWDVDCPSPGVAWCDMGFNPPRHEVEGHTNWTRFQFQTIGWAPGATPPSYLGDTGNQRWLAIRARGTPSENLKYCTILQLGSGGNEVHQLGEQACK